MATCSIRAFTAAPAVTHRAGAELRPETSAASSSRTRVRRDEVPRPGVAVAVLSAAVDWPDRGDESPLTRVEQDPHLFGLARIGDIHAIDQLKTGEHDGLRGVIRHVDRLVDSVGRFFGLGDDGPVRGRDVGHLLVRGWARCDQDREQPRTNERSTYSVA